MYPEGEIRVTVFPSPFHSAKPRDLSSFRWSWPIVSEAAWDEFSPSSGSLPCMANFSCFPSSSPLTCSGKFLLNEPLWFTQLLEISFKGSVQAAEPAIRPTGPGRLSDQPASDGKRKGTGPHGFQ